ncbi:MAG: nucleotide exchange factor GrpE [Spirochaetaceae bacterium]|jgi:molecular chaperone GrpE (heat shock protein)|nr:nucleotide exchange factor GrpE [Spirochaetaceae bacterium]
MAFLDFFRKELKYYADTAFQSAVFNINDGLAEISGRLGKIETKQKETSIQLEELDDLLQRDDKKCALIDSLIALVDTIGDFYFFAGADANSPLFEQAQMMWNAAKNAARSAGLEVINAANEPVNFYLHTVESTEQNFDIPNGYIIKTLKCGIIYQNEIIRRAVVMVNKIDAPNNNIFIFKDGI